MQTNSYDKIIESRASHVIDVMAQRVSEEDLRRIRKAFEFAKEAHAPQKRKTGEPYILHPIAVATIAAEELMLEPNLVIFGLFSLGGAVFGMTEEAIPFIAMLIPLCLA